MSAFFVYINLPLYLAEWATHQLGDPVTFPPGSPQNAVIRTFITERPRDAKPDVAAPGLTAVAIPDSLAKPAARFNHLGLNGKAAVAEAIKDLFLRALWNDLSPLRESPVGINRLIAAWCETHGIDIDRAESVRQCYYRIRKNYTARGVNLRNGSRKK